MFAKNLFDWFKEKRLLFVDIPGRNLHADETRSAGVEKSDEAPKPQEKLNEKKVEATEKAHEKEQVLRDDVEKRRDIDSKLMPLIGREKKAGKYVEMKDVSPEQKANYQQYVSAWKEWFKVEKMSYNEVTKFHENFLNTHASKLDIPLEPIPKKPEQLSAAEKARRQGEAMLAAVKAYALSNDVNDLAVFERADDLPADVQLAYKTYIDMVEAVIKANKEGGDMVKANAEQQAGYDHLVDLVNDYYLSQPQEPSEEGPPEAFVLNSDAMRDAEQADEGEEGDESILAAR